MDATTAASLEALRREAQDGGWQVGCVKLAVDRVETKDMIDAIKNPIEALVALGGVKNKHQMIGAGANPQEAVKRAEVRELANLCGGDMELARDLYENSGCNLATAKTLLGGGTIASDGQDGSAQSISRKPERTFDQLVALCQGNEEFAISLLTTAENDLDKAFALLS